jgi:hypothetical protein
MGQPLIEAARGLSNVGEAMSSALSTGSLRPPFFPCEKQQNGYQNEKPTYAIAPQIAPTTKLHIAASVDSRRIQLCRRSPQ